MKRRSLGSRLATAWVMLASMGTGSAAGQELADFDYENLSFRGFGIEAGYIFPSRVEPTVSFTARFDLGELGPGLRIVPSVTYWKSSFERAEVSELEDRLSTLVEQQVDTVPPSINLGEIEWRDVLLGLDGQYVWNLGSGVGTFLGLGFAVHVMNGEGNAIGDTFIEDLLDRVTAGLNGHFGVEYSVSPDFRFLSQFRYELADDLRYPEIRFGGQFVFGPGAQEDG